MLQFLYKMFNVSALLLDDALKPATPLTNGEINETLRQFAPLSDAVSYTHLTLPTILRV